MESASGLYQGPATNKSGAKSSQARVLRACELRMVFIFLSDYVLNDYVSVYIIALILPLDPQNLKYFLSGPLRKVSSPLAYTVRHIDPQGQL